MMRPTMPARRVLAISAACLAVGYVVPAAAGQLAADDAVPAMSQSMEDALARDGILLGDAATSKPSRTSGHDRVEPSRTNSGDSSAVTEGTTLTQAEAIELARREFGLPASKEASSATLRNMTTTDYGYENTPGVNEDSNITPMHQDQPTWAVSFDNIEVPVLGPFTQQDRGSYTATLVVFLDAETGAFLYGDVI